MNAMRRAAIWLGLWLACSSAEAQPAAKRPRLILPPHGGAAEFRIVEVGGGESRVVSLGAAKALFPSWRDRGRQLVFESPAAGHSQI